MLGNARRLGPFCGTVWAVCSPWLWLNRRHSSADWGVQLNFLQASRYLWLNYHTVHHLFPLTGEFVPSRPPTYSLGPPLDPHRAACCSHHRFQMRQYPTLWFIITRGLCVLRFLAPPGDPVDTDEDV